MECNKDIDTKYQNLATEYSKLRANAAVLKKALLDEQGKSRELKDQLKEHEQRLRKSNQEMESLTFRNHQLTKRISILQEDLEVVTTGKRSKGKSGDSNISSIKSTNVTLLDEELQKKIIDNAQLISAMTDRDLEISNLREIVSELEEKLLEEQKQRSITEHVHRTELNKLREKTEKKQIVTEISFDEVKQNGEVNSGRESVISSDDSLMKQQNIELQQEAHRWKTEYELLLSQSQTEGDGIQNSEQKSREYYYQRLDALMSERQMAEGECRTLTAECDALQARLDQALIDRTEAEDNIQQCLDKQRCLQEELQTTSHNYEQQLSTMSEHLADLNDKYTEQCELIQQLMYQIQQGGNSKVKKHAK